MILILTILALNMLYIKSKNSNITIDYNDLDKVFNEISDALLTNS